MDSKEYQGKEIVVSFEAKRCIHAAECLLRGPKVFNNTTRPWIQVDNAPAEDVARVIRLCPSGALKYRRRGEAFSSELPDSVNTVRVGAAGPLYIRGNLLLKHAQDDPGVRETRLTLCRCGASSNKPFCDNSHQYLLEQDDGLCPNHPAIAADFEQAASTEPLVITLFPDGPLQLEGPVMILNARGQAIFQGTSISLCRCGASQQKPMCDAKHAEFGFCAREKTE